MKIYVIYKVHTDWQEEYEVENIKAFKNKIDAEKYVIKSNIIYQKLVNFYKSILDDNNYLILIHKITKYDFEVKMEELELL